MSIFQGIKESFVKDPLKWIGGALSAILAFLTPLGGKVWESAKAKGQADLLNFISDSLDAEDPYKVKEGSVTTERDGNYARAIERFKASVDKNFNQNIAKFDKVLIGYVQPGTLRLKAGETKNFDIFASKYSIVSLEFFTDDDYSYKRNNISLFINETQVCEHKSFKKMFDVIQFEVTDYSSDGFKILTRDCGQKNSERDKNKVPQQPQEIDSASDDLLIQPAEGHKSQLISVGLKLVKLQSAAARGENEPNSKPVTLAAATSTKNYLEERTTPLAEVEEKEDVVQIRYIAIVSPLIEDSLRVRNLHQGGSKP